MSNPEPPATRSSPTPELARLRARIAEPETQLAGTQEESERLHEIVSSSPNMILINQGERIIFANERCAQVMGYSPDELTAPDFDFMELIAPESRAAVRDSVN